MNANAGRLIREINMLALAAIVGCSACTAQAAEGVDSDPGDGRTAATEQAITNGDDDDADPAVVALLIGGKIYCTGVLIASNVVATAAHCLTPSPPEQVYFGVRPSSKRGTFIDVSDSKAHPDFDEDTLVNDIAVLGLAQRAPVAPAAVLTTPFDASFKGRAVRLVGFGLTKDADASDLRKRSGTTTIASFSDDDFRFKPSPSQTCNGDSGGPALAQIGGTDAVVGLASSGDADCASYGRHVRIDRNLTFLTSYAKAYANHQTLVPTSNRGCSMSAPAKPSTSSALASLLALAGAAALRVRRRTVRKRHGTASPSLTDGRRQL